MTLTQRIVSATYTKAEALHLLHDLEVYVRAKVFNSSTPEDEEEKHFDELFEKWGKSFFTEFSVTNLDKEFRLAEKEIGALAVITVYTPVELSEDQKAKLAVSVRKEYGQSLFLDLRIDESLISGCAIVWEGKYHDYSVKGEWDDIEKIIEKKLSKSRAV